MAFCPTRLIAAIGYSDGSIEIAPEPEKRITRSQFPQGQSRTPIHMAFGGGEVPLLLYHFKQGRPTGLMVFKTCIEGAPPQCLGNERVFATQPSLPVESASLAPNSKHVAISSRNTVQVWYLSSGSAQMPSAIETQAFQFSDVRSVAFNSDGVLAAASNTKIRFFVTDLPGKEGFNQFRHELDMPQCGLQELQFIQNHILCAFADNGTVFVWNNPASGCPSSALFRPEHEAVDSSGKLRPVAVSPDARFVCSVNADGHPVLYGPLEVQQPNVYRPNPVTWFTPSAL
ncbi:MAG: hypothetical protein AAGM22_04115 [Acidobacteriota bacterium]